MFEDSILQKAKAESLQTPGTNKLKLVEEESKTQILLQNEIKWKNNVITAIE